MHITAQMTISTRAANATGGDPAKADRPPATVGELGRSCFLPGRFACSTDCTPLPSRRSFPSPTDTRNIVQATCSLQTHSILGDRIFWLTTPWPTLHNANQTSANMRLQWRSAVPVLLQLREAVGSVLKRVSRQRVLRRTPSAGRAPLCESGSRRA